MVAAFMSCNPVFAQITFSPYTVFGIGDMTNMSLSNNFAMGDIGIGTPSILHINNVNPAMLTHNLLSVFTLGLAGENRSISNDLTNLSGGTGGFKYLAFAFPVIFQKWTTSIGAMPYSTINYNFSSRIPVTGLADTFAAVSFEGIGGLTQVYFSNGYKINEEWSVGLRMSYIFGFTRAKTRSVLTGDQVSSTQLPTGTLEKTNYNGFNFGWGVSYRKKLSEVKFLNLGLIFNVASQLNGNRIVRLERDNFGGGSVAGDTLVNNVDGFFNLPGEFGIGVSYEKFNNLLIGLDIKYSAWNENAGFGMDQEEYRGTLTAGIGVEILPDINHVSNYLSRIRYRVGVSYQQTPNVISGNNTINDFGISFGWSLPVRGVSSLDMAFKFGQRGTTNNNLIKENYFKFVLGATLNDRWFVRRKYD